MEKITIKDYTQIVEDIIGYDDGCSISVVGTYETIIKIFNDLIKSTDADFVAGEIYSPDWDNYDDAYFLEYTDEKIWLGKAIWEGHDCYIQFDSNTVYVEEEFLDKYFVRDNDNNKLIVFKYAEEEFADDNYCMCLSEDGKGFTLCVEDEFGHSKFKYQGTKELTEKDAWEIIEKYYI